MYGLDGKVYGHCIPFPSVNPHCYEFPQAVDSSRKFRCLIDLTAEQINGA
jgi:hypothetical protein